MTERLYYTDSYMQEFSARVTGQKRWESQTAIELDQTAFYPESGGQPADRGWIGELQVLDVVEQDDRILHIIDGPVSEVGESVTAKIDWSRRFDHIQQHTGQHILSRSFQEVIGADTESFHMGQNSSTIDLSVETLHRDEIYAVEELANRIVWENREILVRFVDSELQDQLPLRKESSRKGTLRVVEIREFDYSACGGTHCRQTGEVGLIKIRRWERVRQKARVEFYCGNRALLDYRFKNRLIYQLSRLYSTSEEEILSTSEKRLETERQQRKEIERLTSTILDSEADRLRQSAVETRGLLLTSALIPNLDLKDLNKIATRILSDQQPRVVVLGSSSSRSFLLFARSEDLQQYDMREWVRVMGPLIGGGGGGSPSRAQLASPPNAPLDVALNRITELL